MATKQDMGEFRLVKRYLNRKLYDTHQSVYITLEELAKLIQSGIKIRVIDNKSNLDITYHTFMQMMFEMERKTEIPENVEMLERVIRSNDGLISSYIKSLEQRIGISNHQIEERPRIQRPTWSENLENTHSSVSQNSNISSVESPSSLN